MNPNHHAHTTPAARGGDPHTDLVPGTPPVPITVWRTPYTADDHPTAIPTRLATRLIDSYTTLGEAVIDLTDGHVLAPAAATRGRRHHRAWFTDAPAMIIGPATMPTPAADEPADRDNNADNPPGPRPARPQPQPSPATGRPPVAGAASLLVASWPLHEMEAANHVRLAWLTTAASRLLRPGGCLILAATPPGATGAPEDLTPVVAAAGRAGLAYLQHIVAVHADIDGDQFVYYATADELAALTASDDGDDGGAEVAAVHLRVHTDLFVFSTTGGDADA